MHLINQNGSALGKTAFAERMLPYIAVSDSLPGTAVFLMHIGSTFIPVILSAFLNSMLFTVLIVCKVGTSGI